MEQHLLENGLKTVSDYCLGYSKHVQASYERACRVIREFYGELGFEEYNPVHDDGVYDWRHNYATRIIAKWLREKQNISVLLPYLSAYMGHDF